MRHLSAPRAGTWPLLLVAVLLNAALVWNFHDQHWYVVDEGNYAHVAERLSGGRNAAPRCPGRAPWLHQLRERCRFQGFRDRPAKPPVSLDGGRLHASHARLVLPGRTRCPAGDAGQRGVDCSGRPAVPEPDRALVRLVRHGGARGLAGLGAAGASRQGVRGRFAGRCRGHVPTVDRRVGGDGSPGVVARRTGDRGQRVVTRSWQGASSR